eukprot:jgi/Chlat1/171/Chrsp1S03243
MAAAAAAQGEAGKGEELDGAAVLHRPDDELARVGKALMETVAKVVHGELRAGFNELQLLEDMNNIAAKKYEDLGDFAAGLSVFFNKLRQKNDAFRPYLQQIDEIDQQVVDLEAVVSTLDLYTRRLEENLRHFHPD